MRDAVKDLGGNPQKINPICPADLVIDHSVQVDFVRSYVYIQYIYKLLSKFITYFCFQSGCITKESRS